MTGKTNVILVWCFVNIKFHLILSLEPTGMAGRCHTKRP